MANQKADIAKEIKRRTIKKFCTTILIVFAVFMLFGASSYATSVDNSYAVKMCRESGSFIQQYSGCQTGADFFNTIAIGAASGLVCAMLMGIPLGFVASRAKKWRLYGYQDIFNNIAEPVSWVFLVVPLTYYYYGASGSDTADRISSGMPAVLAILRIIGFYGIFFGMIAYNSAMKKRQAADMDAGDAPDVAIGLVRSKKMFTPKEKYASYRSSNIDRDNSANTETEDTEDEL